MSRIASALLVAVMTTALHGIAAATTIPLVERLTITTAIAEDGGDYESRKQLVARVGQAWRIAYSTSLPGEDGKPQVLASERILHDEDLATARIYRSRFEADVEEDYPGTTALGASRQVLDELRTTGRSPFALVGEDRLLAKALEGLAGDPGAVLGMANALMSGPPPTFRGELVLRRRGTLQVLVDGRAAKLPVIVAGGTFTAKNGQVLEAELSLLDDPGNPLALYWRFGSATLRVVRIDLPVPSAPQAAAIAATNPLEAALEKDNRVVLPGLYFDFGSAVLRPESEATLALVVDAVRDGQDALRLEGHTDNVGAGPANLALSLARARAVKDALVARLPALSSRLQVEGHGATRPRAGNDTLLGRAENRRVELVLVP